MQANESTFDEFVCRHRLPSVVIGIANNEARQDKEEINSQITVIDFLVYMTGCVGFKYVKTDNGQGCYAT
ncbi:hypothetical protein GCM10028825_17840 [Spirosoma agri]